MPNYFTRSRKLPFITVFTLILRNSVKSLQLMLNEFILQGKQKWTITASAFTQARKKLKHTAFMELNQNIISRYYAEQEIKKFCGLRVLAVDASKLTLPKTNEIKQVFGYKAIGNHTHKELGDYSRATFEACYDVLNHIAVKSVLAKSNCYEVDLATQMLESITENDLLIFDRGYAAYPFLAQLSQREIKYLVRCPKSTFSAAKKMFEEGSPSSLTVTLKVPVKHAKHIRELGLPMEIKVRLIRVVLSTNEVEVLATSLIEEEKFATNLFEKLYYLRWGVETFFSKLKGRLYLENFTGRTVESIQQDFWSTIFLSNLETILTEDVEVKMNLNGEGRKKQKAINKAVSFNAIKNLAFDILLGREDEEIVIAKLTKLFLTNPVTVRREREMGSPDI